MRSMANGENYWQSRSETGYSQNFSLASRKSSQSSPKAIKSEVGNRDVTSPSVHSIKTSMHLLLSLQMAVV